MNVDVHPEFTAHGSFAHLKLGKKPRREDARTLMAVKYLDAAAILPTLPVSVDYTFGVPSWPMYGNDALGDCTLASVGHMIQGWSQAAGGLKTFSDGDIEAGYWETGTPPAATGTAGSAQDDGRDEISVLNYWRQTGIGQPSYADRIVAYMAIDPTNLLQVKMAIYLFGGVYVGIGLPLTAQGQAIWDVVPADPAQNQPYSWGGHAVPILAYDDETPATEFTVITWGAPLKMTTAFWNEYGDEAYAIVSPDFLGASGVAPNGFDLERLEADLAEITQQ